MNKTAQVVLINEEGLILGVSRKDDHNDFGLIGGKMDPEDNDDPMVTAIRECKEETGLNITNLRLIFLIHKDGFMGYTYLADYSGEISFDEPHVVKWQPMEVIINGKFGRYNKLVSESLEDMGIFFQASINIIEAEKEIRELINITFDDAKLDYIHKSWSNLYTIFLIDPKQINGTFYIDLNDNLLNKLFDDLNIISKKYSVKFNISSSHYPK